MGGQVDAYKFLFLFRFFIVVPGLAIGDIRFCHFKTFHVAEQGGLHVVAVLLVLLAVVHQHIQYGTVCVDRV